MRGGGSPLPKPLRLGGSQNAVGAGKTEQSQAEPPRSGGANRRSDAAVQSSRAGFALQGAAAFRGTVRELENSVFEELSSCCVRKKTDPVSLLK